MAKKALLGEERRAAIADAAIRLVATRGVRGLTHRAVDAELRLPAGSTSYYLRTRHALLAACVERLLALDAGAVLTAEPRSSPAEVLVDLVVSIPRARRDGAIARYELRLEATRQPALAALMDEHALSLRATLAHLLHRLGVPDAEQASGPVAAMLDGLVRDRIAGPSAHLSEPAFAASVRRCVEALLRGLAVGSGI